MSVKASIVVSFTGAGVLIAELDLILNGEKTSFNLEDEIYFGIYRYPNSVVANNPISSFGQCEFQYTLTRTVNEQIQFSDRGDSSLTYPVSSDFTVTDWYGREGTSIGVIGQDVTIESGWPCIADVSYNVVFDVWRLFVPDIDFTVFESWPILILVEGSYDGS